MLGFIQTGDNSRALLFGKGVAFTLCRTPGLAEETKVGAAHPMSTTIHLFTLVIIETIALRGSSPVESQITISSPKSQNSCLYRVGIGLVLESEGLGTVGSLKMKT